MDIIRRLKPHHLRLIERTAVTGKLQIAADALNISQPAASRILSNIEESIGADLFQRTPKGMVPTQIGTAFLGHARTILTAFDNMETEIEGLGLGQTGEVKIGAVTGPAVRCLVPAILAIKADSPEIEPTLEVAPSNELVRLLERGHFDFVIARLPPEYDSRAFHLLPARSEDVSLVVRAGHPLVDEKNVSLETLAKYDWTIQERGTPIRTALEDVYKQAGISMPRRVTNTSSLLVTLGLLEHSDTIATMIEEVAQLLIRDAKNTSLRILDATDTIRVSPYYIIHKRDRQLSRIAERLLEEAVRRF